MNDKKEIEKIAKEICNYVASKNMTKVYVIGTKYNPLAFEFLHNTGIAEWLVDKGYGDTKAAAKEAVTGFQAKLTKWLAKQYRESSTIEITAIFDKIEELLEETK